MNILQRLMLTPEQIDPVELNAELLNELLMSSAYTGSEKLLILYNAYEMHNSIMEKIESVIEEVKKSNDDNTILL